MNFFEHVGRYSLLIFRAFSRPDKNKVFYRQVVAEIDKLGTNSIGIVAIISLFIGGILALQVTYNMSSAFMPDYLIGLATRDTLILEFSSTVMSLILAGKIGANIASEIGSMRVSDQIDSMKIMGVNPPNLLIMPKIIAMVFMNPILFIISVIVGLVGGALVGVSSGIFSVTTYVDGIRFAFNPFFITFSLIKAATFGFVIATIPAYYGYYAKGGALSVGKASTDSVVRTSIIILILDLAITQLFFK